MRNFLHFEKNLPQIWWHDLNLKNGRDSFVIEEKMSNMKVSESESVRIWQNLKVLEFGELESVRI